MAEPDAPLNSDTTTLPRQIFLTESRDFLLDAAGQHVKGDLLDGKVVGVVIGPHWLPVHLEHAISVVVDPYKELLKEKKDIVFVYVGAERDLDLIQTLKRRRQTRELDERPDPECFNDVLKKLPEGWLAVPLEDSEVREKLCKLYRTEIFSLAFVGADGRTHTKDGLPILEKWGAEAYPFDDERIDALKKVAQERRANQNFKDLLVHDERDDLIASNDSQRVKVQDLEGKTVGLYFSAHWCPPCRKFTPVLATIYKKLKESKEDFEIVFVSADEDQTSFDDYFNEMPWLAVPYSDLKTKKLLNHWFEVEGIPTLIILDKKGKTLQMEGTRIIYKYGIEAYPFTAGRLEALKQDAKATAGRLEALKQDAKAKRATQTLETLLVTEERDYVISKLEPKVNVSSLKGKTVGLYFSAHWCPPCQKFTPKLKSIYDELKRRGEEFEVIFISSDRDEEAFKNYYDSMPWLALPYNDKSKRLLSQHFDVQGIPQLVIIGPDGRTVTTDGRGLIGLHGADAFPFTSDRIDEVKSIITSKAEKLPKEITISKHEHVLSLTDDAYGGRAYGCDECDEQGFGWVYHCAECGYDLHPDCAGDGVQAGDVEAKEAITTPSESGTTLESGEPKPGFVCEGDACHRV